MGASAAGAKVHTLPEKPRDIDDDGEFHFAVLGPKAVSDPNKPSDEAKRFINETTAADRPRASRNALVLAVPSRDGLDAARRVIRDYLGWEEVRSELRSRNLEDSDPIRWQTLTLNLEGARKKIPDTIQQAYSIVVTVSDKNEVVAFKISPGSEPLFSQIKADSRSRIQDTSISAEAVVPGGPYDLWREGESSRFVKDLVGAFAQFTRLPKMLNRRAILDTLVQGCKEGLFILRHTRPDRSVKTFWREEPDDTSLKEPNLEAVLPESATLTQVPASHLVPEFLPGLWEKQEITFRELREYFSGQHIVKVQRQGYEEPLTIPHAPEQVLRTAVHDAVRDGKLWLISGPASVFEEIIPPGVLTDDATLQAPPPTIQVNEILPQNLPEAWNADSTTAYALSVALSIRFGKTLPWKTLRDVIDNAYRARLLERTVDSAAWPSEYTEAKNVRMKMPDQDVGGQTTTRVEPRRDVLVAEADLRTNQIQDLAEHVADIARAAVGEDLKFHLRIELGGGNKPSNDVVAKINEILKNVSDRLILK